MSRLAARSTFFCVKNLEKVYSKAIFSYEIALAGLHCDFCELSLAISEWAGNPHFHSTPAFSKCKLSLPSKHGEGHTVREVYAKLSATMESFGVKLRENSTITVFFAQAELLRAADEYSATGRTTDGWGTGGLQRKWPQASLSLSPKELE